MSKFGEPWGIHYHSLVPQTRVRMYWLRPPTDDHAPLSVGCENVAPVQRIVACINALDGVEDPAAALQAALEALRQLEFSEWADGGPACPRCLGRPEVNGHSAHCSLGKALRMLTPKEDKR